ncbi:MAG: UDP-N-acetylmuramate dehydrogenase [Waddliaceae bacterium]|jgi:UDP-N-acetylmuramate dehydrogenase|nr:UDP-N-acetylmuramate dehydrogenase [Waddliaceae bacterium]MBT3578781.1 UDP-N-acetylmuramate dehydrogenase [Waddliaceae bacterium]MBT4445320.1 UDP-N-acetylmuramate dehydrogenase [Waddliaceae bacterium]MBT6928616.1 UDP-N-acetylmuramate dehydrogenase [Waddliaceae bacterium]MBT7265120.1 UDP-N-acetylmuramate dehydrogenase [Waddliaceae bacterium]
MQLPEDFNNDVLLSTMSTFGIGGPARHCVEVSSVEEMQEALRYCYDNKLRYIILGKGSNCLFDDRGFDGVIIVNKITFIEHADGVFTVGGGYSFALLGIEASKMGLSGLEFAAGIPGTVGGAVAMNAGAAGSDVSDVIVDVVHIDEKGESSLYKKEEIDFGYRHSSLQKIPGAVVAATLSLKHDPQAFNKQNEIVRYRKETQPWGERSAGCVFRNPASLSAGALIEGSFMKGAKVGGARVSNVHANFIVNEGGATCEDVFALIATIKKQVKKYYDVVLEEEIRYIPYQREEL